VLRLAPRAVVRLAVPLPPVVLRPPARIAIGCAGGLSSVVSSLLTACHSLFVVDAIARFGPRPYPGTIPPRAVLPAAPAPAAPDGAQRQNPASQGLPKAHAAPLRLFPRVRRTRLRPMEPVPSSGSPSARIERCESYRSMLMQRYLP
jgi:hypothetical protein